MGIILDESFGGYGLFEPISKSGEGILDSAVPFRPPGEALLGFLFEVYVGEVVLEGIELLVCEAQEEVGDFERSFFIADAVGSLRLGFGLRNGYGNGNGNGNGAEFCYVFARAFANHFASILQTDC